MSLFKRITSKIYYRLFSYLSGVEIEPGAADFRLIDRQVLDEILKFKEEGMFLRGIVHWVGYATTTVSFDCRERHAGKSGYSLRKMVTLAWHGVSSFSLVPLRIAMAIGLLSSTLAFLGVGYAIVGKWVDAEAIPGWASTVAIVSFLFGVLFVFLAVLAEYIGRIMVEVRGRPRFLVRETTRAALAATPRATAPAAAPGDSPPREPRRIGRLTEAAMSRGTPDDSAARFALVGCTNFVVSFTVFYLAFRYLPPDAAAALARAVGATDAALHPPVAAIANVLAYLAGMVNSFLLNRSWTFRAGGNALPQALRFGP